MVLLTVIDIVLFVIFLINISYLLLFSLASRLGKTKVNLSSGGDNLGFKRIAVLIPAYKEDSVIMECVVSCLDQNYPQDKYDVVVISDRMSDQTVAQLQELPIKVVSVNFENSTKSKALNYAMKELGDTYDIAVILDADNTISPEFLSHINSASLAGCRIIQAHRCAKNVNTYMALLDAASEEMNNSIFRQGHVNLGLSAALIGSGMAFDYHLFKETMSSINAIGGFDRALELTLLRKGEKIAYLPNSDVLDEKVQHHNDFSKQRRRWLSAQMHYMLQHLKEVPAAIVDRNIDFCDKMFQQMSMPRVLLIGFCAIITFVMSFVNFTMAIKWWVLLIMLATALAIAIPKHLMNRRLMAATLHIPYTFMLMALNMFRLRGANKKFIHTSHGVKS